MKKFLSAILIGAIFIFTMSAVFAANYIGNSNSRIFHYPDCSSINKMNPSNKVSLNSRDEAIQNGYRPCKRCSP